MTEPNLAKPASRLATPEPPKNKGKSWGRPFPKGVSGNPGGRKKAPVNVVELARSATAKAMQTMIDIMENDTAPYSVRAYCADKVMDRALGKPPQSTNLNINSPQRTLRELSDAELLQIIEEGREKARVAQAALPAPPTIEVEPNPEPQPKSELSQDSEDEAA
jgi:hypothetical protein